MGNPNLKSDSASLLTLDPEPDAISLAMATLISCKNGCSCPGREVGSGADQNRHAATKPEVSVLATAAVSNPNHGDDDDDDDEASPLLLLLFGESCRQLLDKNDCVLGNDDDDDNDTFG
jgi:hypothetical protein